MAVLAQIFKIAKMIPLYFLSEISKYCQNMQKNKFNFSADSLDYGRVLKKFENNPWIRITVLNYTVVSSLKLAPCKGKGKQLNDMSLFRKVSRVILLIYIHDFGCGVSINIGYTKLELFFALKWPGLEEILKFIEMEAEVTKFLIFNMILSMCTIVLIFLKIIFFSEYLIRTRIFVLTFCDNFNFWTILHIL